MGIKTIRFPGVLAKCYIPNEFSVRKSSNTVTKDHDPITLKDVDISQRTLFYLVLELVTQPPSRKPSRVILERKPTIYFSVIRKLSLVF